MSVEDNKNKLKQFAEELRKLEFPTSPISLKLVQYVSDGIDNYLNGNSNSLDTALGLTRKPGRPTESVEEHKRLASRVLRLKLDGSSWPDIFEALSSENFSITDERTIRRIYERYFVELAAEEICRRLDKEEK